MDGASGCPSVILEQCVVVHGKWLLRHHVYVALWDLFVFEIGVKFRLALNSRSLSFMLPEKVTGWRIKNPKKLSTPLFS